jgi:hypothetical protein
MKKSILLGLILCSFILAQGQDIKIKEPEFIGNVVFVNDSIGDGLPLEFQQGQLKVKSNGASFIPGASLVAGKTSTRYYVDGVTSPVVLTQKSDLKFIVRPTSNLLDPVTTVKIYSMKVIKKSRTIELASYSSLGRQNDSNIKMIAFKGKKYGQNSYLIDIPTIEPGEYAISTTEGNFYMFSIK